MGMYDSVWVECPRCHEGDIEFQSKAGDCTCTYYYYPRDKIPAKIAGDLDGDIETCPVCGHSISLYCHSILIVG